MNAADVRIKAEIAWWEALIEWASLRLGTAVERWEHRKRDGRWVAYWRWNGRVPRD